MSAGEEPLTFFKSLDKLGGYRDRPFPNFARVHVGALGLLYEQSVEVVEIATSEIKNAIDDFKKTYVLDATERQMGRLYEEGGWELAYLPGSNEENFYPTRDEILELIHNWPCDAADQLCLPVHDDIDDLEALRGLILDDRFHHFVKRPYSGRGISAQISAAEAFAVLALIKLDEAASFLLKPEIAVKKGRHARSNSTRWKKETLISASNLVIEATEIVFFAREQLSIEEQYKLRTKERETSLSQAEFEASARTKLSKLALAARYAPNAEARDFVRKAWFLEREHYQHNKSKFVRSYVDIVANKFKDLKGNPLKVTKKQIYEVWLRDSPATGTPAG